MGHNPTTKRKRGKHRPQCPCAKCVQRRETQRMVDAMPGVFVVKETWGK